MIITIGRQHGSGGHMIAKTLAAELGIKCYSKELVDEAAANSQFSKEIIRSYDEKKVSPFFGPTAHYMSMNQGFHLNMQVASAQFDTIRSLAEKGDAIFVGRCVDYVLRNRDDLVRFFIHSDLQPRIENLMMRKNITAEEAKKLLKEVDKDRASYYKYYTDQVWGEMTNYDLCVNSARLGVQGTVDVLMEYLRKSGFIK